MIRSPSFKLAETANKFTSKFVYSPGGILKTYKVPIRLLGQVMIHKFGEYQPCPSVHLSTVPCIHAKFTYRWQNDSDSDIDVLAELALVP